MEYRMGDGVETECPLTNDDHQRLARSMIVLALLNQFFFVGIYNSCASFDILWGQ